MDFRTKIFTMSKMSDLKIKFSDSLSQKVNLSNYSWFNLGGDAEYFFKPKDKIQLLEFLKDTKDKKLNIIFLGAGSNTLFRNTETTNECQIHPDRLWWYAERSLLSSCTLHHIA